MNSFNSLTDLPSTELASAGSAADNEARLADKYGENSLLIARYALLAQSAGKPLRKRDLMQALKPESSELSRREFARSLQGANSFLRDRLGMSIVELGTVPLKKTKGSPQRDECALISLSHADRKLFNKVSSKQQRQEWGVMCFVLIIIVLKSDGVGFSELYTSLVDAKLSSELGSNEAEAEATLSRFLQRLAAQRVLEVLKATRQAANTGGNEANAEPEDVYYIGPYAKYLVKSSDLYKIMLKIHYPLADWRSEEFQRSHTAAIRGLKQKFESTCLGSIE